VLSLGQPEQGRPQEGPARQVEAAPRLGPAQPVELGLAVSRVERPEVRQGERQGEPR